MVKLYEHTIKALNNYLDNERDLVTGALLKRGCDIPANLFINLRDDKFIGEKLIYRNYINILKRAAKKAGFDEKSIRIHSGRRLNSFSEEERKIIYIDSCMNYREVELGVFLKHTKEGSCKRLNVNNCAMCSIIYRDKILNSKNNIFTLLLYAIHCKSAN